MNKAIAIILLHLLALSLASCETVVFGVEVGLRTPGPTPTGTLTATTISRADQTTRASAPSPTLATPQAVTATVCFDENIANGNLRVRECAGLECAEVGLLSNGDRVRTNGERKDANSSTWLHLVEPVKGWVNIRYICDGGSNGSHP